MKAIPALLLSANILLGCNSSSADYSKDPPNGGSEVASTKPLSFSLDSLTITVEHKNMEVSEECPEVLLSNAQNAVIDQRPLCEVNIEGYRNLDARKDFAFINFENYRMDGDSLIYNIDLALLQGSAFIAECHLPIANSQLGSPKCKKRAQ